MAGGKGAVSLELLTNHGVRATLVDPYIRKGGVKKNMRKRMGKAGVPSFCHIAAEFGPNLWASASGADGAAVPVRETATVGGVVVVTDRSVASDLRAASVLIGLHPDEATMAIVEGALALQTPFAVVPCCVFANLHPGRVNLDGTPVTTSLQLCDWLVRLDPR